MSFYMCVDYVYVCFTSSVCKLKKLNLNLNLCDCRATYRPLRRQWRVGKRGCHYRRWMDHRGSAPASHTARCHGSTDLLSQMSRPSAGTYHWDRQIPNHIDFIHQCINSDRLNFTEADEIQPCQCYLQESSLIEVHWCPGGTLVRSWWCCIDSLEWLASGGPP